LLNVLAAPQGWVARIKPAARGDPVGLVQDSVWIGFVQISKDSFFHQLRVQCRDTIDAMRHHKGQLAHLDVAMLDDAHIRASGLKMAVLDHEDDLMMTRQNPREQILGPAFQRFWQKRVVGVAKTFARHVDARINIKAVLVAFAPT